MDLYDGLFERVVADKKGLIKMVRGLCIGLRMCAWGLHAARIRWIGQFVEQLARYPMHCPTSALPRCIHRPTATT